MAKNGLDLSVVIPIYNEEENIGTLVDEISLNSGFGQIQRSPYTCHAGTNNQNRTFLFHSKYPFALLRSSLSKGIVLCGHVYHL